MNQQPDHLLLSLGIHKTLLGFHYLRYALELCLSNENYLLCFSALFHTIADHYNTNADNVSHCIHTAVEKCWYNGNQKLLTEIAGYPMETVPPNSEFIDILFHCLEKDCTD